MVTNQTYHKVFFLISLFKYPNIFWTLEFRFDRLKHFSPLMQENYTTMKIQIAIDRNYQVPDQKYQVCQQPWLRFHISIFTN